MAIEPFDSTAQSSTMGMGLSLFVAVILIRLDDVHLRLGNLVIPGRVDSACEIDADGGMESRKSGIMKPPAPLRRLSPALLREARPPPDKRASRCVDARSAKEVVAEAARILRRGTGDARDLAIGVDDEHRQSGQIDEEVESPTYRMSTGAGSVRVH
jgi:hypothetical protein